MTFDEIQQSLKELRHLDASGDDPEKAHSIEDDLLWQVVDYLNMGEIFDAKRLAGLMDAHNKAFQDRMRWFA